MKSPAEVHMRRRDVTATLALLALLGIGSARADVVVLKDGRTITTVGPPVLKGRMALLKTPDGQLFSISADEIDAAKTEAARLKPTPTPPPAPTPVRSLRPAEIAGKTPAKKATVVLTDEQVAAGNPYVEGDKKPEEGEPLIEVSNASSVKTPEGYQINGSLLNAGKAEAAGVSVTIEAVSAENKTISSVFGEVAKDRLAPGEKSSFKALMAKTPEDPRLFRYLPQWQTRVTVKSGTAAGGGAPAASPPPPVRAASEPEGEAGRGEFPGTKPPEATPTPKIVRVPQPDIAPPAANAPIGAPDKPGGTFLPKPTGDQPKPPSGG